MVFVKNFIFNLLCTFNIHKFIGSGIKILAYHGICPDDTPREHWLPVYFVTKSNFEEQIRYIAQNFEPITLKQAVHYLKDTQGSLSKKVVITFDDGYANNLHLAIPILEKYQVPVTIYIATNYIKENSFFPFDKLRLLEFWGINPSIKYKDISIVKVIEWLDNNWDKYCSNLSSLQKDLLRALKPSELDKLIKHRLVEIGAHTHNHCILKNENRKDRDNEIITSLKKVREWTGHKYIAFSYPNGEPWDFDEDDISILKTHGCYCAVTTIPGNNIAGCDFMRLKRYSIGINHNLNDFKLEVSGFKTTINRMLGKSL